MEHHYWCHFTSTVFFFGGTICVRKISHSKNKCMGWGGARILCFALFLYFYQVCLLFCLFEITKLFALQLLSGKIADASFERKFLKVHLNTPPPLCTIKVATGGHPTLNLSSLIMGVCTGIRWGDNRGENVNFGI